MKVLVEFVVAVTAVGIAAAHAQTDNCKVVELKKGESPPGATTSMSTSITAGNGAVTGTTTGPGGTVTTHSSGSGSLSTSSTSDGKSTVVTDSTGKCTVYRKAD